MRELYGNRSPRAPFSALIQEAQRRTVEAGRTIGVRIAMVAAAGALGVFGGTFAIQGGTAAITAAAPEPSNTSPVPLADVAGTDDCAGCSDYERGARFARRIGLDAESGCSGFSWSYTRGCLAYVRGEY